MIQLEIFARDKALETVLENAGEDWRIRAETVVCRELANLEVTGEDMRLLCLKRGIKPHHHNAWGGFVGGLLKRKVILPTGRFTNMKAKGSHARMTRVYRVRG